MFYELHSTQLINASVRAQELLQIRQLISRFLLLTTKPKHANLLLRNTSDPITCYPCSPMFRKKNKNLKSSLNQSWSLSFTRSPSFTPRDKLWHGGGVARAEPWSFFLSFSLHLTASSPTSEPRTGKHHHYVHQVQFTVIMLVTFSGCKSVERFSPGFLP